MGQRPGRILFIAVVIFFIFIFRSIGLLITINPKPFRRLSASLLKRLKEILEQAGFEVEIRDSIYVDTTKALQVLKQVPEADEVVKVNRTVYLTINRAVTADDRYAQHCWV